MMCDCQVERQWVDEGAPSGHGVYLGQRLVLPDEVVAHYGYEGSGINVRFPFPVFMALREDCNEEPLLGSDLRTLNDCYIDTRGGDLDCEYAWTFDQMADLIEWNYLRAEFG